MLRPNPIAPRELRLGRLRVFYEVNPVAPTEVRILAVGIKQGHRLTIGGKEVRL